MTTFSWIVVICWLVFGVVWTISAFKAKESIKHSSSRSTLVRVLFALVVVVILNNHFFDPIYVNSAQTLPFFETGIFKLVGDLLTILGVGLAFWARFYIGRNWGMPMTERVSPELVTGGPYAYIRHPIYTGVIAALIGTAFATAPILAVICIFYISYFIYSAKKEEKRLIQKFPAEYPAYMRRTKMLIPFIY